MKIADSKIFPENETTPSNFGVSIIEIDDPLIKNNFDHRFQIMLEINQKRVLPKHKKDFLEFDSTDANYNLQSEKTNDVLQLNEVQWHEKQLCDKSLEECNLEMQNFVLVYNEGRDMKEELSKIFDF